MKEKSILWKMHRNRKKGMKKSMIKGDLKHERKIAADSGEGNRRD